MSVSHIEVSGGAGGTEAKYEDFMVMGTVTSDVSDDTFKTALAGHKFLAEPDVLASALLNPGGVVKFEAAMAVALDGPSGLTATAAGISLRGDALRATKVAYELADELAAKGLDATRWLAGKAITATPVTAATAALLGGGVMAADVYANYGGDWQKWLVDHPGMVDTLIGMSPGMLSSLGIPLDLAATLDLLAATYPDSEAVVTDIGRHDVGPPHSLKDIMDGLSERNDSSTSNIDVRVIRDANGNVTGYVVDVPGTKDWPLPGSVESANDLGVNVDAMAGNKTVLQAGIEEALRRAGAGDTGAPVMLVGHSQGGIVAAQSTGDLIAGGYNVTHVVTAGSPIGRIDVPGNVQVLSLENRNDIVPHLDASDNPDSSNRTTVTFDNQNGTFGDNHAIPGNYTDAAQRLDTSSDPSVQKYLTGTSAFTSGNSSETRTFKVDRRAAE